MGIKNVLLFLLLTIVCLKIEAQESKNTGIITLSWFDNSSNETGFMIERSIDNGLTYQLVKVLDMKNTKTQGTVSWGDTTVERGKRYTYRVRAYNIHGNSGYTEPVSAVLAEANFPPRIFGLRNQQHSLNSETTVSIPINISDDHTKVQDITVTAEKSKDPFNMIGSVSITGSGARRSLNYALNSNADGKAMIKIEASDGSLVNTDYMKVEVYPGKAPVISFINNINVYAGESTGRTLVNIQDSDTPKGELDIDIHSSNLEVLESNDITTPNFVESSISEYEIKYNGENQKVGKTTINLSVTDGKYTTTRSYTYTVLENKPPSIVIPPMNFTIAPGSSTNISIGASGGESLKYQWYEGSPGDESKPIIGATGPSFTTPILNESKTYWVKLTNNHGSLNSGAAVITVDKDAGEPPEPPTEPEVTDRLANASARGPIHKGHEQLILGFVVAGSNDKLGILARGMGPSLLDQGVLTPACNVTMDVHHIKSPSQASKIHSSGSWASRGKANTTFLEDISKIVGAFPFNSIESKDAAAVLEVGPGVYTVNLSSEKAGVALAELYDLSHVEGFESSSKLVNTSLRADIQGGEKVIIKGIVITGDKPQTVMIRAVGQELEKQSAALVGKTLKDPMLGLFKGQELQGTYRKFSELSRKEKAFVRELEIKTGAFPLEKDSNSAVMFARLQPGLYTAVADSETGTNTGTALVETYLVPD